MRSILALAGALALAWPVPSVGRSLPAVITPGLPASSAAGGLLIPMPHATVRLAAARSPIASSTAASNLAMTGAPPVSCHEAAVAAERDAGLPTGMLDAIGRVESGRFDPETGEVWAWPWAVNAAGAGRSFASFAEAASFVRERQAAGAQSIDVGCFQINLLHHPDAFASLEEAFDPAANAAYAARFLTELHDKTGDWTTAVAWYHSANPGVGAPYRDMVLARWPGHETATNEVHPRSNPMPRITQVAAITSLPNFGIRVWSPGSSNAGSYEGGVIISMRGKAQRMPGIVTASR